MRGTTNPAHDRRQKALANEGIGRLLFRLSLPAAIGMSVMTLYNVIDTVFIGHSVGSLGIAGLSIVFPAQILIMGIGQMIGMGGASMISRALGARDEEKASRALGNAFSLVLVLSALLTSAALSNSDFWLRLLGASDTVLPHARDYFNVIFIGTIFQTFAMSANGLVRAEGNARVPMTSMLIGALLNIVLDAVLIMALGMGTKGAALATVLSQAVTSIYMAAYYISGRSSLRTPLRAFIPRAAIIREMLLIGSGSFARTAAGSIVTMVVNRVAGAYGGDIAVAAFGLVHRIMMFVMMPVISISQGLQPILGFNYGAKRFDRALRSIGLSSIAATAFSIAGFAVIMAFSPAIMRVFSSESELIAESSHAAKLVFFVVYLVGFQIVGSMVFQTIGKALPTLVTATSRQVLFLLPLLLILPRSMQLDGVWWSFAIADSLSFLLTCGLLAPLIRHFRRSSQASAPSLQEAVTVE